MKTGAGLAVIAVGAILAFAIKGSPSWLNIHIAGWVILIAGIAGLVLPRRTYGWLGRRMQVRRSYPSQAPVQPYATRPPGIEAPRGPRPTLLAEDEGGPAQEHTVYRPAPGTPVPGSTEVIEDLYEQP
jgi:hypothetical protein